jgi:hypothetical protein
MRVDEIVSLSAQWHTISWTDHLSGAGFHWSAARGTFAMAPESSAGPRA